MKSSFKIVLWLPIGSVVGPYFGLVRVGFLWFYAWVLCDTIGFNNIEYSWFQVRDCVGWYGVDWSAKWLTIRYYCYIQF